MNFLQADSLLAFQNISLRSLKALFTIRTIARAVERDAYTGTGRRLGRELGSNQPNYLTIPISLAASSQTQMGSTPSSNFRQRLSQSIIGTKQLNVEGTDSGPPFLSHTRNLAGCSPSLVQEVGLRICSFHGQTQPYRFMECCLSDAIGRPIISQRFNCS